MYNYRLSLVLLVGLFLISPIIMDWWFADRGVWYTPFVIWLVLILIYAVLSQKRGTDEL